MNDKKYIAHSDDIDFEEEVKELLLYRKIVKVEQHSDQDAVLTLDNGTEIIVEGNRGCGGCGNGWYYLDELNDCDNVITDVRCIFEGYDYDKKRYDDVYRIIVFADNKEINCVQYSGNDNGYYGTGYELFVRMGE